MTAPDPASAATGPAGERSPQDVPQEPSQAPPPGPRNGPPILRAVLLVLLVGAWLGIAAVGGPAIGSLSSVQSNDQKTFLPPNAESVKAAEAAAAFTPVQALPAFVVFATTTGQPATQDQLASWAKTATLLPPTVVDPARPDLGTVGDYLLPDQPAPVPSQDGQAGLLIVQLDQAKATKPGADGEAPLGAVVTAIRGVAAAQAAGGTSHVTGPAGIVADLVTAFAGIDGILLVVAVLAVLVILILVYRAVALPFLVLISAVSALALGGFVVYHLAKAGPSHPVRPVAGNPVHPGGRRCHGLRAAAGVPISGGTAPPGVHLAGDAPGMAGLPGADRGIGRDGDHRSALPDAVGAELQQVARAGRRHRDRRGVPGRDDAAAGAAAARPVGVLAPRSAPRPDRRPGRARPRRASRCRRARPARSEGAVATVATGESAAKGLWAAVARFVGRHPRRIWVVTAILLGVACCFVPTLHASGTRQTDVFLDSVDSVAGQDVLAEHFPGGAGSPAVIIAPEADAAKVAAAAKVDGVVAVVPLTAQGPVPGGVPVVVNGQIQLQAELADLPDSDQAKDTVSAMRDAVHAVSPSALVGGQTAIQIDSRAAARHDLRLIIPLILIAVFLVLILLLRALIAPLVLIAATVLSFGAALGVSALVFNHVFGFPGADPGVPLYAFVFLVALGIDYSIFLMTRAREETGRHGPRDGVLRALRVTGGVITSAGVVLATTFAALGVIPILFLAQIAFIVAFGVLLDTLVVRSLLVPAVSVELGRLTWWPGRLSRSPESAVRQGPAGR